VNDINEGISSLQRRLRWVQRLRAVCAFLFLAPLIGYPLFVILVQMTDHGPERGMVLLPLVYYGLFASPLLLLPLAAWIVFYRQSRMLRERLNLATRRT
jgi:hypothetical protein